MLKRLRLKWKNTEVKIITNLKLRITKTKLFRFCLLPFNFFSIFAHQRHRGRAARHRSAKPSTPVRIRTMPRKPSRKLGGFFIGCFWGINYGNWLSFVIPVEVRYFGNKINCGKWDFSLPSK